jgi:hypothetical protein
VNICDFGWGDGFLGMTPKAPGSEKKRDKLETKFMVVY